MDKITPCLWFDDQAEAAANFYVSIFRNSRIDKVTRYVDGTHRPIGSVMTVEFELDGRRFTALNGGPMFKFTEAVSFQIDCADQAEVDMFWGKLSEGGETGPCGWLKDRWGLSWQVVPRILLELVSSPDTEKARRVTEAMLQMGKLDVAKLEAAAAG